MSTCYCDPNPKFKPASKLISAITNANPAEVTTTLNHEYLTGTVVRLYIPQICGMEQIDGFSGEVTVTGPTTFTVNVNATSFDPFAVPADEFHVPGGVSRHYNTCAMVVPIGENSSMLTAAERNVL